MTAADESAPPLGFDYRDDDAAPASRVPSDLWSDNRLRFLSELARRLHQFGTTTTRLEGSVESLSNKLGLDTQIWSSPTGILLSFRDTKHPGASEHRVSEVLRLSPGETNLRRLVDTDAIAEQVFQGTLSVDEGYASLRDMKADPVKVKTMIAGFAFAAASVAAVLKSRPTDIIAAAIIGMFTGILFIQSRHTPDLRPGLPALAAFLSTLLATLASAYLVPLSLQSVTLAAIVVFLPGLTLTVAVSELSSQHLVAGVARFAGALTVLLQLTFGAVAGSQVANALQVPLRAIDPSPSPVWVEALALLCGAMSYSLLLQPHKRHRLLVMGAAVLGYSSARLGSALFGPQFGVFLAGLVVAAASNLFARVKNKPSALVRTPGILLLVPGSVGFRSLFLVFDGHVMQGIDTASALIVLLTTLVAGLLFGDLLIPPRRSL
ncbi:MAG: threonine/serine exporter family protein [Vicinamibacteria bacterium]